VAASVLSAAGLPEFVTTSLQAYESFAIELASCPGKPAAIRQRLADLRLTSPLFDTGKFAKHIEAAYVAMHERYLLGLGPDDIHVAG
jgi:predicted O-linked N-acetylglucosamine transferase (SPINDLY family)